MFPSLREWFFDSVRLFTSPVGEGNQYVMERAYLEGLWRYSKVVGAEHFPQGLFQWPLTDEYFQ